MSILPILFASSALVANTQADQSFQVIIDTSKEKAPISKYVYGQFIEHLGRCINGGIWAEVLEDRKFFHPVGGDESPWKPIGPADLVVMDKGNAYVGEHSPRVALSKEGGPRGLVQEELGLRNDVDYTGRIVLWKKGSIDSVHVTLKWGSQESERQSCTLDLLKEEPVTFPLRFSPEGKTHTGCLEITAEGDGELFVGCVSLMPADNVNGLRADTLALLKELDSPVYRWPGGNFVSGYDWKDGIGAPDKRPPRKNPAWQGIEPNDFGLDEFLFFCRELGTEPYIVVNSGLGEVDSAVGELEYANGAPDTTMGRLRAEKGHPGPYGVKWWGIGNEMYGDWQLGHMPLEEYAQKHNRFAEAMRRIDASIQIIGVGAVGEWSETMLRDCSGEMKLLSEHFYNGEKPDLLEHIRQIPDSVKRIADAHRKYRKEIEGLAEKDIRIAIDEWNYWYGPQIYGEIGVRYHLKDALGVAAGLHEFARNADLLFMGNYAQTVNVIGCIKTTKTDAAFDTTGLVLKLYRRHLGTIPVEVTGETGDLDVLAALAADKQRLTVAVVNPSKEPAVLECRVVGRNLPAKAMLWEITGPDENSYNEPGKEPNVTLTNREIAVEGGKLPLAPLSVSLFVF